MRDHGTHACYVHGPNPGSGPGCRCTPCSQANTAYEKERARRIEPPYVCASSARDHINWLSSQGVGSNTIARISGISHGAIAKIIYGDKRRGPSKKIRVTTRDAILAVRPNQGADGSREPAGPTLVNIATLVERGWTKVAIARAIGQQGPGLQIGRQVVTRRNARTIAALLDQPVPPRRSRHGLHPAPEPEPVDEVAEQRAKSLAHTVELDRYQLPVLIGEPARWMARGACRRPNVPTWLFFPQRGDNEVVERAKAVCATCPVQQECLEAALATNEPGVWGGTTSRERELLTGRRRSGAAG